VAQLLERLATGDLDIAEPATRQHVPVAVTRLRRYLVETDEVPDQLSHELHACADAAERRGIAVDLMASVSIPK
jgi:predicted nuclease of predicted toxin-antitoxin system